MQIPDGKCNIVRVMNGRHETIEEGLPWLTAMNLASQLIGDDFALVKNDEIRSDGEWNAELSFRTSLDGFDLSWDDPDSGKRETVTFLVVESK